MLRIKHLGYLRPQWCRTRLHIQHARLLGRLVENDLALSVHIFTDDGHHPGLYGIQARAAN